MRNVLKLVAIVLLFQSFQCEDQINEKTRNEYIEELKRDKQIIKDYIASFPCDALIGCNTIAFGSKPCGGPWEYLVFSNAVDLDYLTRKVTDYNLLESAYNSEFTIVSDCAVVNPPTNIGCVNGVCAIIP
ncbi:MAG: hypothetical protein HC854_05800 [Flavobacterium sp.]|nr:hypothetical protein [Flavobacterium sp.]